jgi:hypothetical protein
MGDRGHHGESGGRSSAGGASGRPGRASAHIDGELAIRLGSALFSKLSRRSWELPHVAGKPLVLAIQNFAREQSLHFADTALAHYLYGFRSYSERSPDGRLLVYTADVEAVQGEGGKSFRRTSSRRRALSTFPPFYGPTRARLPSSPAWDFSGVSTAKASTWRAPACVSSRTPTLTSRNRSASSWAPAWTRGRKAW